MPSRWLRFFGDVKKTPHVSESQEIENNLDKIDQEDLQVIDDSKFVSVVSSSFHTKPDEVVFEDPTGSIERNTDGVMYTDSSGEKKYLFKECSQWHEYRGEEVILGKVATGEECVPENYFRVNDNVLSSKILYIAENAEFILMTTTGSGDDGWNYFLIKDTKFSDDGKLVGYDFVDFVGFSGTSEFGVSSFYQDLFKITLEPEGSHSINFSISGEMQKYLNTQANTPKGSGDYQFTYYNNFLTLVFFNPYQR